MNRYEPGLAVYFAKRATAVAGSCARSAGRTALAQPCEFHRLATDDERTKQ